MNRKMTEDFVFIRPMEAPVFCPTVEEFKNPLAYLNKIRPTAEKAGICKIRPPPDWQPPFAVDVDNFRFTPRIQRLNELEAKTRVKLNFLDNVAKYYELSGNSLKIPVVDKKALDLYSLYKLVVAEGGRHKVNNDKKWNRIAVRMGYPSSKNYGPLLKLHYDKILVRIEKLDNEKKKAELNASSSPKKAVGSPAKANGMGRMGGSGMGRMAGSGMATGSGMTGTGSGVTENNTNSNPSPNVSPNKSKKEDGSNEKGTEKPPSKELRRLMFYSAGPKMSGFNKQVQDHAKLSHGASVSEALAMLASDPLAKYTCRVCDGGESVAEMLICEGCDDANHIFCLDPPLNSVPPGDWKCSKCVAEDLQKPGEAFGFEQAQREYTLQQFGEMADQFKAEYFNIPVHMVPMELVEKEFWRIVSAIDEDVMVEYGADLHTMDHGSGFPTKASSNLLPPDDEYINSGWNLNNIPLHPNSVFRHIHADISGMKVPWMYVGMCFATFCWHNEDHWSYSINYLHWGEPKTWYGVPGAKADDFENAMKQAAPELFHSQPDLLHQLVTIMNPNILMKAGVPVYRMDQKAGEFIITFPRAYHAGFNQGYNFAEAVNFAPADWLPMGRDCVRHYSNLHRYCVFSHDELVCKMASEPADLDITIAVACYKDMLNMFEAEKELRGSVLSMGVKSSERVPFELLPDDERICDFCKATCFLSAITCACSKDRLVCLKHYKELCDCPPDEHILKYRYTLDEIPTMLKKIKSRTEAYETWIKNLHDSMHLKSDNDKLELEEMKDLIKEMEEESYPKTPLAEKAIQCLNEAEKCVLVARKILTPAIKTRNRVAEESRTKVTVEDLVLFSSQLSSLQVKVKETDVVKGLLEKVEGFKVRAMEIIKSSENRSCNEIKEVIEVGQALDLDLPLLDDLVRILEKTNYLDRMESLMESRNQLWSIEGIAKAIYDGKPFRSDARVEEMIKDLSNLQKKAEKWESDAKAKLKQPVQLKDLEKMIEESEDINVSLASLGQIKDMAKKARDWETSITKYGKEHPFFEDLNKFVEKGELTQVELSQLNVLKNQLDLCKSWKEKCAKLFFKKPFTVTLIEILMPRKIEQVPQRGRKKKFKIDHCPYVQASGLLNITPREVKESSVFEEAYEEATKIEITKMMELRKANLTKCVDFNDKTKFCVCQGQMREVMLKCDLCLERYHTTCIPLAKDTEEVNTDTLAILTQKILLRESKWLCRVCSRSKRPDLLKIINVLEEVSGVPVRMLERNAMKSLAKRGVDFREKALELLRHPEIDHIVKALDQQVPLQSDSTSSATSTTASHNPSPVKEEPKEPPEEVEEPISLDIELKPEPCAQPPEKKGNSSEIDMEAASALILFSHAGSEEVKDTIPSPPKESKEEENDDGGVDHAYAAKLRYLRDLNLKFDTSSVPPKFFLSDELLTKVDNLMAEGLLVEANIPELDILWSVMEACKTKLPEGVISLEIIKKCIRTELKENNGPVKRKRTLSNSLRQSTESVESVVEAKKQGKRKSETQKKRGPKKKSKNEENFEDCAAKEIGGKCKQPSGSNVGWVQCETCELWFHYVCVGVTQEELDQIAAYACSACFIPNKQQDEDSNDAQNNDEGENGKRSECSNKENTENLLDFT